MLETTMIPRKLGQVEVNELEDGFIIQRDDTVHIVNESGKMILDLCDGEKSIADIISAMKEMFAAEQDAEYVVEFIQNLIEAELVAVQNG